MFLSLEGYDVRDVDVNQFARELVLGDHKVKLIELETDGIFVEMALIPNSKMVAHFVELDSFGRIKVDCGDLYQRSWYLCRGALSPVDSWCRKY